MYQPPHFREDDLNVQHALMRAHPLGLLITAGASGLIANSVPFHLDAGASDYLAKPVNTEQLLAALRMWLHR